jgi:PAS domain S-box-containing protein
MARFFAEHLDSVWFSIGLTLLLVASVMMLARVRRLRQWRLVGKEREALKRQIEFILGATKTGLDIIDSEFNIQYIDPEWRKVYGDPTGRKCHEYFMGRKEVCPGCGAAKALETRTVVTSEQVLPREGDRPIQVTSIPFQDSNGQWLVAQVNVDIAERKRVEEALRTGEERYRRLFEQSTDAIFVADPETRMLIDCNEKAETMTGCSRAEILSRRADQLHPEDVREKTMEHFRSYSKGLMDASIESVILNSAGERVHVSINAGPVNAGGKSCLMGIFRDITSQKRTENRLKKLNQTFLNYKPDPAENIRSLVATCGELLGATCALYNQFDSGMLRTQGHWHAPEDFEFISTGEGHICYDVIRQGRDEIRLERKLLESAYARSDPNVSKYGLQTYMGKAVKCDGRCVGALCVVFQEDYEPSEEDKELVGIIAAAIGVEEHRQHAARMLLRIRAAVDDATDAVVLTDGKGEAIYTNSAFAELLQYDLPVVAAGGLACLFAEAKAGREVFRITQARGKWKGEVRMKSQDGKEFPALLRATAILNEKSPSRDKMRLGGLDQREVIGAMFLIDDLTASKRIESELRQSQKLTAVGQLASGIAHEINTPTQYVGDNTRFLQKAFEDLLVLNLKYGDLLSAAREGRVTEELLAEVDACRQQADFEFLAQEVPQAIRQSLEGIERVTRIVRAMRDMAHPDSGEKLATDINRAIENTVTVSRNEWKYVADVLLDLDAGLPLVPCLAGEFSQVILNIIINAAQAITEVVGDGSSGKGKITVSTRCLGMPPSANKSGLGDLGRWVEIRISDTGTGIPEEVRSRIFDPFFTTKEVGKGTGQGLTISRSVIVDKHGGTLTFETETGKGTTFIIRLPVGAAIHTGEEHEQPSLVCG